jgi:anti-sigma factor RsiW
MIETFQHHGSDTINACVDGQLPAAEKRVAQQHLVACHSCALRVLSAMQLKAATARAGHCFASTSGVGARLTARLRAELGPVARIHSVSSVAWAALAAGVVLAVSLLGWNQFRNPNTLAGELRDQHLAVLYVDEAPQVISSDRLTVKPWFQGRLPFSFNLPESEMLPPHTTLKRG